jgi:hypothetical protein
VPDALEPGGQHMPQKACDEFAACASTTMIHTHVPNRGGRGVVSPVDRM